VLEQLNQFTQQKAAWWCLFLGAGVLVLSALYFQHVLGHEPCVMCIYQRTAVIGIMFAALIPVLHNTKMTRAAGLVFWAISSVWGFLLSTEHLDILTAPNPFFAPCDIVPNFPSFMPLYDWLPNVFGAPGDCLDQAWQLMGMGMPAWMQIIFGLFSMLLAAVIAIKIYSMSSSGHSTT